MCIPTYLQTYRHTDIQTYRHTDVQTYWQTYTQTWRHVHADRHTDILLHIQNIGFGLPSRHAKVVEAVYNNQGLLLSRTCFEFRMKGQVLLGAQAGSHETLLWYPLEFQDNEDFWCSTPEEGQGFSLSLSLLFP